MGRHLHTSHRAVLTSQKLAKSNVQTSLCDRREPANASSLYLAVNSQPLLAVPNRAHLSNLSSSFLDCADAPAYSGEAHSDLVPNHSRSGAIPFLDSRSDAIRAQRAMRDAEDLQNSRHCDHGEIDAPEFMISNCSETSNHAKRRNLGNISR